MHVPTVLATTAVLLAGGGTGASGLRGVVTRGPVSPVCVAGRPCSAPFAHARIAFVRGGRSTGTVADAAGRYRVALPPGSYAVRIVGARFGYAPRRVVVPVGRFGVQDFSVDTGIR